MYKKQWQYTCTDMAERQLSKALSNAASESMQYVLAFVQVKFVAVCRNILVLNIGPTG